MRNKVLKKTTSNKNKNVHYLKEMYIKNATLSTLSARFSDKYHQTANCLFSSMVMLYNFSTSDVW